MNNGYTLIPDSFLDLPLDIYETTILAIIHGFSQDGESTFKGSLKYLVRKSKCSRRKVMYALEHLVELGYITKIENIINGVTFNEYRVCISCRGGAYDALGGGAYDAPNNTIYENIDNREIEKKGRSKFVKPSVEEVAEYCRQRGNNIDAEEFCSHYNSNGWMVGKTPMKDWKSAIITWEKKRLKTPSPTPSPSPAKKSALQNNLEVMDKIFGTNASEQVYGTK